MIIIDYKNHRIIIVYKIIFMIIIDYKNHRIIIFYINIDNIIMNIIKL